MKAAVPVYRSSFITVAVDQMDQTLVDPTGKEEFNSSAIYVGCEFDGSFEIIYGSHSSKPTRPPFSVDTCCDQISNVMKAAIASFISSF